MSTRVCFALLLQLSFAASLAACDDEGTGVLADAGPDAMGADCPNVGMGSLAVTVTGLPPVSWPREAQQVQTECRAP